MVQFENVAIYTYVCGLLTKIFDDLTVRAWYIEMLIMK